MVIIDITPSKFNLITRLFGLQAEDDRLKEDWDAASLGMRGEILRKRRACHRKAHLVRTELSVNCPSWSSKLFSHYCDQ
jgi:hypothetical protein